ncbi:C3H1-type domain-containing protein [Mycena indigotica]|uniref:C3H1-type domain-containing protein n=1 Tax=Mycena indigotica TaxID=2126181 RepID=A0A8H6SA43_9AGAR|nr:C3H1-type domain-containing protein [Mycena indigotica]KAF7295639.1 C3H1-type domain-containing protein [Mycena indigotica]
MTTIDAPWRIKTRPCPFYQQGRCVFDQSCNFIHDPSVQPSNNLPELLDVLRDVLEPQEDTISMAQEHGVSPHISGEGWTLVNDDAKDTNPGLLSPVSLDLNLARISTIKNPTNHDSFDSGYGSDLSFVSPQPLPSTLNLISSPFGSPTSRMSASVSGIGLGASRLFSHSPFSPGLASPYSGVSRNDTPDLDSPSTVRRSASTITPDDEVEEDEDSDGQYATAQWDISNSFSSNEPPSRFSSSTIDDTPDELLQPGSRFSSTTLACSEDGSDSDSDDPPEDATAQLAYLVPGENDTINTLYDVYMSPRETLMALSDSEQQDEERGRTLRARVFTPPPREPRPKSFNPQHEASSSTPSDRSQSRRGHSRTRSGFPTTGPRSVFSVSPDTPPRPLSSMSIRNKIPFSFRSAPPPEMEMTTASPESIGSSQPLPLAQGKVPFGFRSQSRNSYRDSTFQPVPASASATRTTFANESPKPYVRKRRISRSVAPPASAPMRDSSASSFFGEEPQTVMVKGLKSLRLLLLVDGVDRPAIFILISRFPSKESNSLCISVYFYAIISLCTRKGSHNIFIYFCTICIFCEPQNTPHAFVATVDTFPSNDHHKTTLPRPQSRIIEPPLRSAPLQWQHTADQEEEDDTADNTIRRRVAPIQIPQTRPTSPSRAASALGFTHPTTSTPLPTRLLFAIASDDPEAVRHVLESGEVGAEEMEAVGPEGKSAVKFALENTQLGRRMEIAKVLASFGAKVDEEELEIAGPAIRYFIKRAGEEHAKRSSALIHRSFFRPLARVRYELVGQDRALEQLFRVLSMHSQKLAVSPVVVLLCGPSGHGKSLLARRFGALLDVPTHTVNMTTLRNAHDLWTALSMGPDEEPSSCTLAEFLINNEGKRCVVILDEIEKVEEKTLWSLLMPWESGRCSFEANSRHVDTRNVLWLGTSNVGQAVIAEHHAKRARPDELMSREEYVQLMKLVREPVSRHMGTSILSRVTTVLPFVPFTIAEQSAICAEAFYSLGGEMVSQMPAAELDGLIRGALGGAMAIHNHARMMRVRRATASTTSSGTAVVDSAAPASTMSVVNFQTPAVTKTLEVVVAILAAVILLGVGFCFFRHWKRRHSKKESALPQVIDFTSEKARPYDVEQKLDLHASAYILEKPSSVYMPGASAADMNPNWVPQIPQNNGKLAPASSKKSKGSKKSLRSSRGWDKTFSKFAPSERSPPPSYMSDNKAAMLASQVPLPPSPPHQSHIPPTPPTPPAKKTKLSPISPTAMLEPALPPLPVVSPTRSESFAAHQSMAFAQMAVSDADTSKLMNVVNPFTPTMDDELPIQVGETVRVLEEFQDGWALVQRLGRMDAPKGVVPVTCLRERPVFSPNRRL